MTGRINVLSASQVAVAAVLLGLAGRAGLLGDVGLSVLPAAVAFGVVGSLSMYIELRRHACAVTVVEAVLIAGLFHLDPVEVVVAATLGEMIACVLRRQPLKQLAFNVSGGLVASVVAALVFAALGGTGATDSASWLTALLAASSYGFVSHTSTSAVLSVVEQRRFEQVFNASFAPSFVATVVSATIGLLGVVLASVNLMALLLVAPLVVLMVVETRRLAGHRADHLRFKRLYAASSRTARLTSQMDAMATLAGEARSLVTGAAAICCSVDRNGTWEGVVVSDSGNRPAADGEVEAVVALLERSAASELTSDQLPRALRYLVPSVESLVFAASGEEAAASVVVAVTRQLPGDHLSRTRTDVLGAFIGHAALTIANARLYGDVEDALAHQLDLNRQKDDFVAAVSHELRTPLTSMIGSMGSMRRLDEKLTPEKRAVFLEIALRQGDRLKQLIEDLLLLSRVEDTAGSRAADAPEIDLRAMVAEIAGEFCGPRSDAPAVQITFETNGTPPLRCDEGKLRQILTNLVENARKYAPESPVRIMADTHGDQILIDVVDHGNGIGTEDRERVFGRFVQLDQSSTRAKGGTGLGLYLCRQLAHALGGTLELSEPEGGGCRFTVSLPWNIVNLPTDDTPHQEARPLVGASSNGGITS